MSSFQYYASAPGSPDRKTWWKAGEEKLLKSISGASDHLIYISDTPHPIRDIPSCLASRNSNTCDSSEKSLVFSIPGFEFIDPTPWLCSSYCPAIIDGVVAYRDASHISVAMSKKLLPKLEEALIAKGLFS
jgi:hypothetical protein